MAISEVTEDRDKMEHTSENGGQTRTYVRYFLVTSDGPDTSGDQCLAHPDIPNDFEPYSFNGGVIFDGGALARQREARKINALQYEVVIRYTTQINSDPNEDKAPLDLPVRVRMSTQRSQIVVQRDISGNAIVNSAQERFDEYPVVDDAIGVVTLERNIAVANYSFLMQFTNRVNSSSYFGFSAGQLRLTNWNINGPLWDQDNESIYFNLSVSFEVRENYIENIDGSATQVGGHDLVVLDQGFNKTATGGTGQADLERIGDANGVDIDRPALLDGSGDVAANFTTPSYRRFVVYNTADFSQLGLLV